MMEQYQYFKFHILNIYFQLPHQAKRVPQSIRFNIKSLKIQLDNVMSVYMTCVFPRLRCRLQYSFV